MSDLNSTVKGNDVTLKFKMDSDRPSSTGKSTIRYTTSGFKTVGSEDGKQLQVSITLIKK